MGNKRPARRRGSGHLQRRCAVDSWAYVRLSGFICLVIRRRYELADYPPTDLAFCGTPWDYASQ